MNKTILLIEDDPFIIKSIKQVFPPGYQLDVRKNLESSYEYLSEKKPAMILLDRTLPDGDGIDLLEYISQVDRVSPLLIISGKAQTHDRIEGLRKGADDYLIKPFSTTELLLRVERLMKTTKHHRDERTVVGPLELLYDRGHVLIGQHLLRLRKREFQILGFLAEQQGHIISRDQMINHIWPDGAYPSFATIDVYIRRLRMMLGKYGKLIKTVKGYGYTFSVEGFTSPSV